MLSRVLHLLIELTYQKTADEAILFFQKWRIGRDSTSFEPVAHKLAPHRASALWRPDCVGTVTPNLGELFPQRPLGSSSLQFTKKSLPTTM